MKRTTMIPAVLIIGLVLMTSQSVVTGQNIQNVRRSASVQSVISITDSGWTTPTSASDCATGQADDTWQLTLTQSRNLTITVADCCCPGDYFEVRVDGNLIGTTQNLAPPWGCSLSGPLSSGSFTVPLCPGTHTITVRDAGFDGHSLTELQTENMCPAGFTVSGSLSAPTVVANPVTGKLSSQPRMSLSSKKEAQELQQQIQAVEPYVISGKDGMQKLSVDQARKAGVSPKALALGHKLVVLNNRIMMAARRDEGLHLNASDFAFIEPLFLERAQQGNSCGDRRNPTPCPAHIESNQFFSTEDEVKQHLVSLGFHLTPRYASLDGYGSHYSMPVSYQDCPTGSFRIHAIIRQQENCWTYSTQGPEPNPELLSYRISWPYLPWAGYVHWWHTRFC